MVDQKDRVNIQNKERVAVPSSFDVHEFERAIESLAPPSLQFRTDESQKEEEVKKSESDQETFQYSLDGPPDDVTIKGSKVITDSSIQGRFIAEPFKIPTMQKTTSTKVDSSQTDRPSFTLQ